MPLSPIGLSSLKLTLASLISANLSPHFLQLEVHTILIGMKECKPASMMAAHLSTLWKSRMGTTFIWINKNAVVSTLFLTCYFVCSCVVFDPLSHLDDPFLS